MNKLSMILIPGWIEQPLRAAQVPLSILTDINKLSSTLSKEDVAFYVYCQELFHRKGPAPVLASFCPCEGEKPPYRKDMENSYVFRPDSMSRLLSAFYEKYPDDGCFLIEKYNLENHEDSLRPCFDGLFDTTKGGTAYRDYVFDAKEIADGVIGVKLIPLETNESRDSQEHRAYDKLVGLLNVYTSFKDVATTAAFNRFCELSRNNH